jgi:hypothetical protein
MRVDFMLIVLNGEPWINAWLKTYEPHANKIFIIEGTDKERFDAMPKWLRNECHTKDGHSVDNTRDIVRSFKSDKIVFIDENPKTGNGFWASKNQMIKQVNGRVEGQYLWEADCDEFCHHKHIKNIKQALKSRPNVLVWQFNVLNFWRSASYVVQGGWVSKYRRIFKWNQNTKFKGHRPPHTNTDGPPATLPHDLYHYSYVLEKDAKYKPFYHTPLYGKNWFEKKWLAWNPTTRKAIEKGGIGPVRNFTRSWTKYMPVDHPEHVKPVLDELIKSGRILK